jgi:hypothetical protein
MNSLPVVILSTRHAAAALACVCVLLSGCKGSAMDTLIPSNDAMATVTATGTAVGPSSSQTTADATGGSIASPDDLHLVMGRLVQLCGGPVIFAAPRAFPLRGLSPC